MNTITTFSGQEFNRDSSGARRAANDGPVFITDRGRPAHVLLNIGDYRRLTGQGKSLLDAVAQPGGADIEFDPPRLDGLLRLPELG